MMKSDRLLVAVIIGQIFHVAGRVFSPDEHHAFYAGKIVIQSLVHQRILQRIVDEYPAILLSCDFCGRWIVEAPQLPVVSETGFGENSNCGDDGQIA